MNITLIKSIVVRGIFVPVFLVTLTLNAQETEYKLLTIKSSFQEVNKAKMFKPVVGLETWATYSMGEEKNGTTYANRGDVSFRRFRFGASGEPYSWLKYYFQLNLDRLGEDPYASTKGSYSGLGIWNANITVKLIQNSELLHIEAGYFWAAISREFNTSSWAVGSLDKMRSVWYLRNFVTGRGNGIESGIALGGLKNFDRFGISYRLGSYEPALYQSSKYGSRLYTGRIMFSFGDPEQTSYKYMLSGNQWRKRNGVTLGLGGSTQANGALTDSTYFDHSSAYGADILVNYKGLRIDGEYFLLNRNAEDIEDFDGTEYHIRVGYSFIINGKYIEPVVTYSQFEGEGNSTLYSYIGNDDTLDVGVNWYINKEKLKLALHYVMQEGSASSNTGDYVGLCCQVRL
jgi:hypothetical protein